MSELKQKKQRITKVAAEYNITAESILELLRKKNFEVKTINSVVSDEMLDLIHEHFKKDIEKAEKHYKKLEEFNKKRTSKQEKEEKKDAKVEEEKPVAEVIPVSEVTEEKTVDEVVKNEVEEIKVEEVPEISVDDVKTIEDKNQLKEEEKKTTKVSTKKFTKAGQKEIDKITGLKVLGKLEIKEKEQPAPKKEPAESGQVIVRTLDNEASKDKVKKKPKKKKVKVETPVVEDPANKKKKKFKRPEVDAKEVKDTIRRTLGVDESLSGLRNISRKKKKKERKEEEEQKEIERDLQQSKITVTEFIAVNELANLMNVSVSEVISKCISLGFMVSINQRLEIEKIILVADEFGFEVEIAKEFTSEALEDTPDTEESLQSRSPVVTIMGHVDHGKTSLLDYIRRTNVVAGESGGITQHIGAYKVDVGNGKQITFLDTPGHEAFTAMRARGAQLTDIVVLIVAADDAVMPQTVEAINHALAATVPIVIAINKVDKPGTNIEKIKQQLADRKILVEDWGGKYQCVEISAKNGLNIDLLLEKILLEAELLDLKANPDRVARGVVIESELDKGRGITGTILVQKGTLKIGDPFVAGIFNGKVRAMFDERGNKIQELPPSSPVVVLGFEGAPQAGDTFVVVESDRVAREIAIKRQQLKREQDQKQMRHITLDEIARQIKIGGVKELPLIVKGDVDGSVEALSDSLMKLSNQEVIVRVIHRGVGGISESDVLLAAASSAIIVGFHVRPNINARKLAETQKVDIRLYSVIYDAINEVKSALEGLLSPVISEEVTATVEVRDIFKVPKVGTVAGSYVQDGKINRHNKVRLIRDGIVILEGEISSLKRFKDDVRDVEKGYECGVSIANFNDIKVGDIIEAFKIVETKKKLE